MPCYQPICTMLFILFFSEYTKAVPKEWLKTPLAFYAITQDNGGSLQRKYRAQPEKLQALMDFLYLNVEVGTVALLLAKHPDYFPKSRQYHGQVHLSPTTSIFTLNLHTSTEKGFVAIALIYRADHWNLEISPTPDTKLALEGEDDPISIKFDLLRLLINNFNQFSEAYREQHPERFIHFNYNK